MTNSFHFGLLQCILFCCLFVAKLPLTCAKLNSIPLNRARGPLNDQWTMTVFSSPISEFNTGHDASHDVVATLEIEYMALQQFGGMFPKQGIDH